VLRFAAEMRLTQRLRSSPKQIIKRGSGTDYRAITAPAGFRGEGGTALTR
jgi:hypothetical protein